LFIFYTLAKDDFIFIRRNITLEQLFDTIFLGLPIVLLLSRITYIALHPKWIYVNPLVFLALPYFPGLFLGGGIIGAILFLYFFTRTKKIPTLRFSDEISLAFLPAASFYFLCIGIQQALMRQVISIGSGLLMLLYIIGYVLTKGLFKSEKWRDGAVASFVLVLYSLFSLLYATFIVMVRHKLVITPDEIFYIVLFILSIIGFLLRRGLFQRSI
jgi:hypothetical protein